jgi:hypothetical protein
MILGLALQQAIILGLDLQHIMIIGMVFRQANFHYNPLVLPTVTPGLYLGYQAVGNKVL